MYAVVLDDGREGYFDEDDEFVEIDWGAWLRPAPGVKPLGPNELLVNMEAM